MNRDIRDILADYCQHPSELMRVFPDIYAIYKPANTVILGYNYRQYLFIYNKFICEIKCKSYKCCNWLQCDHNIFNRYNILHIEINTICNIYYHNMLYEFDNYGLYAIYNWIDKNNECEYSIHHNYYRLLNRKIYIDLCDNSVITANII